MEKLEPSRPLFFLEEFQRQFQNVGTFHIIKEVDVIELK